MSRPLAPRRAPSRLALLSNSRATLKFLKFSRTKQTFLCMYCVKMMRNQSQTRRRAELNAALIQASATGDVEDVNQLLHEGADVRAHNNYALRSASQNGHVAVVYRLMQVPGMSVHDVVAQDNFALKMASENGHYAVVDLLLQVQGLTTDDVRAEDNFALKSARQNGHAAVVNRLSEALMETYATHFS